MIAGIPNQPIDFVGDDLIICGQENISPLMVAQEDDFIFQFTIGRCADAEEFIAQEDFSSGWLTGGDWDLRTNNACAANGQPGATLEDSGLTSIFGDVYEVEVLVNSIGGSGIMVSFGGVDTLIQSAGAHTFIVTATEVSAFVISLVDESSSVCLFSAQVYAGNTDVEVKLVAEDTTELFTTTIDASPQYFSIEGTTVTAIIPVDETNAEGCFKLFIVDPCADTYGVSDELCSQSIKLVDDCKNTVKFRVCNDHNQPEMGFVAGRFEMRAEALVILPTWSYDVSEERLTNGLINRHRIDREEVRELRIKDVSLGYSAHRFLSALAMFDHFYIGEKEYSVDVEEYQPSYPDSESSTGSVKMTIRAKQEVFRKVLCEPLGPGCNPKFDPICPTPAVVIGGSFNGEGQYTYYIVLVSMVGFVTEDLILTVNGVPEAPIPFNTAPQDVEIGPYDVATVIGVQITNATRPECNWTTTLVVPCDCTNATMVMTMGNTVPPSTEFADAIGVDAVRSGCVSDRPSWTINGGVGGGGLNVLYNTNRWYVHDGNGNGYVGDGRGNFDLPCDVTQWYFSPDGVSQGTASGVDFCGGSLETCEPCCGDGPGCLYFDVDVDADIIVSSDSGYFTIGRPDDSYNTYPTDDTVDDLTAGEHCLKPSNEFSFLSGKLTKIDMYGSIQSMDFSELDTSVMETWTINEVLLTGWDIPDSPELYYITAVSCLSLTDVSLPEDHILDYVYIFNCPLTEASVDAILVNVEDHGVDGGTLYVAGVGTAPPSAAGLAAKAALELRGWIVTVN
jgi:hypothetical protein